MFDDVCSLEWCNVKHGRTVHHGSLGLATVEDAVEWMWDHVDIRAPGL